MMKCSICGKEFEKPAYGGNYSTICSSECFRKAFWQEKVDRKDDYLIIEGVCYYVGDENDKGSFRGFSGRKFYIRKRNGQLLKTTNLWCQGDVPDEFRDELRDNAEFVREGV